MATTREDIEQWFKEGVRQGATHMVVVCDTFDWEDFPVYVEPGKNPRDVFAEHHEKNMEKVMEVYSLKMPMEDQLNEHRAFHFD